MRFGEDSGGEEYEHEGWDSEVDVHCGCLWLSLLERLEEIGDDLGTEGDFR